MTRRACDIKKQKTTRWLQKICVHSVGVSVSIDRQTNNPRFWHILLYSSIYIIILAHHTHCARITCFDPYIPAILLQFLFIDSFLEGLKEDRVVFEVLLQFSNISSSYFLRHLTEKATLCKRCNSMTIG